MARERRPAEASGGAEEAGRGDAATDGRGDVAAMNGARATSAAMNGRRTGSDGMKAGDEGVGGSVGGGKTRKVRRAEARRRGPGLGWRLAFGSRGGRARGFLRFWPFYEKLYSPFHRTRPIPGAASDMLRVRFIRFRGQLIDLPDGTRVAHGDRVVELHFHNRTVARVAQRSYADIMRGAAEDLAALAAWAARPDFPADVKALYGVTILSRAAPRLGFITRDQPLTIHTRLERFFMMGLLVIHNPRGVDRLRRGSRKLGYPQEIWMSRGELLRRYGATLAGE